MHIHFTSIGGSVMHQLAIALHKKGYHITGTDDEIFEPAKTNLEQEGLLPTQIGWQPQLIHAQLNAVILGMHARADNPELQKAQALQLPIYSFPEYIYQESKDKTRIVVGGSHGKTSTTAMIMHVLKQTEANFDYLVGAKLEGFSQSVQITNAPLIVCEGDEYPASVLEKRPKFHFLYPHVAIITGIAWDHINVFPTFNFYLEQFIIFIQKIEKGGVLIYNEEDAVLKQLVEENLREDIRYQPYSTPSFTVENGITQVTIEGMTAALQIFGNHNLQNLMAAYYACATQGITTTNFLQAIGSFTGAAKRLELLASNNTCNIYRDFAHAPSKLKATIHAVKQQFPTRKLVAIFELHTYSSLNKDFLAEYNQSMQLADDAVVFFSAHALEIKKMPPLAKETVAAGFNSAGLMVMNNKAELMKYLENIPLHQTNILLMSSGNYEGIDVVTWAKEKLPNT